MAGDNARATYMLGEMREIYTTHPAFAGNGHDPSPATAKTSSSAAAATTLIDTGVYGPYDNGDIQVISFNFNSDAPEALVTGVAGAVQVGNWNNLRGGGWTVFGDTPDEPILFQDGRPATGVTIEWGRVWMRWIPWRPSGIPMTRSTTRAPRTSNCSKGICGHMPARPSG